MFRSARQAGVFWSVPVLSVAGGLAYFVAAWASGDPWLGAILLAIMVVFAGAALVASRYSETVRGLMERRDERIVSIDAQAVAVTGQVLIVAVVAGGFIELARGHSGAPYTWLGALAGVTYVGAIVFARLRR
jgi:uncharacterized membrane protein